MKEFVMIRITLLATIVVLVLTTMTLACSSDNKQEVEKVEEIDVDKAVTPDEASGKEVNHEVPSVQELLTLSEKDKEGLIEIMKLLPADAEAILFRNEELSRIQMEARGRHISHQEFFLGDLVGHGFDEIVSGIGMVGFEDDSELLFCYQGNFDMSAMNSTLKEHSALAYEYKGVTVWEGDKFRTILLNDIVVEGTDIGIKRYVDFVVDGLSSLTDHEHFPSVVDQLPSGTLFMLYPAYTAPFAIDIDGFVAMGTSKGNVGGNAFRVTVLKFVDANTAQDFYIESREQAEQQGMLDDASKNTDTITDGEFVISVEWAFPTSREPSLNLCLDIAQIWDMEHGFSWKNDIIDVFSWKRTSSQGLAATPSHRLDGACGGYVIVTCTGYDRSTGEFALELNFQDFDDCGKSNKDRDHTILTGIIKFFYRLMPDTLEPEIYTISFLPLVVNSDEQSYSVNGSYNKRYLPSENDLFLIIDGDPEEYHCDGFGLGLTGEGSTQELDFCFLVD